METIRVYVNQFLLRRVGLFRQRRALHFVALLDLTAAGLMVILSCNENKNVHFAMPKISDVPALKILLEVYLLMIIYEMTWAVGTFLASLSDKYNTLERIALRSAYQSIIVVLIACIFTFFATYLCGKETGEYMWPYLSCLCMEFVYPLLMYIMLIK